MKEKLTTGLFLFAVFITFLGPIADLDFFFHLKTGEFIYEHRTITAEIREEIGGNNKEVTR